ncbi:glutathione S-transferase family protein [Spartinivicinus ruber]|uniref:glutathione S-transferase family protein n=1 Tax=Spartinivicinus ruber TaxID=2683272 RepID=UPI0013CF9C7C|nr:glutathione S-transferase N-terminal domain-containing protein [Spartinivicinus ruber]
MELLYSDASPFARAVRIVIRQLQLNNVKETVSHPFNNEPILLHANPLGKVPCLIIDDQQALMDSEVICDYLDQHWGKGQLYQSIKHTWPLHRYFTLTKGVLELAVAFQQEKLRKEQHCQSGFWLERMQQGVQRSLNELAQTLKLLPDTQTIAHVFLGCCCDYLSFRHAELQWQQSFPALAKWFDSQCCGEEWLATKPGVH